MCFFLWQPSVAGTHCFSCHVSALIWQPSVAGIHCRYHNFLAYFFVRVYIFYHMFLAYCFVRSYRINSNSHVIIVTEASSQTRTVGAFWKLNNGDECGWRHSSSHTVQDRKATHSAAGIISAAPVTSEQPTTRPA